MTKTETKSVSVTKIYTTTVRLLLLRPPPPNPYLTAPDGGNWAAVALSGRLLLHHLD